MNNRDFKGVWIPKEIWLNPDLTLVEKCLLVEIDSLDNEHERGCFASNEYLATFIGKTEGTTANIISDLRKRGFLETCSWDGRVRGLRVKKNESSLHEKMKADFTNSLKQPSQKNEGRLHEKMNIVIQDSNTVINTDEEEENAGSENPRLIDEAVAIINFFNEVSGRKVSANVKGRGSENVMMVAQLLRKGYTREELEQMIVFKCWEWKDSPKMAKHLEPVTIFKRHGAQYIQQAIEARENPAFLAVLKRAHDAEGKNQPITNGEITRAVAERLLNW